VLRLQSVFTLRPQHGAQSVAHQALGADRSSMQLRSIFIDKLRSQDHQLHKI
jgi:hypothetical protein